MNREHLTLIRRVNESLGLLDGTHPDDRVDETSTADWTCALIDRVRQFRWGSPQEPRDGVIRLRQVDRAVDALCVLRLYLRKTEADVNLVREPQQIDSRIYVAGSSDERLAIRDYITAVAAVGYQITCNWTLDEVWNKPRAEAARMDLEGVRAADVVWYLVPAAGKSEGAAAELGGALILGKTVVVSGLFGDSRLFPYLAQHIFMAHENALEYLVNKSPAALSLSVIGGKPVPTVCPLCHSPAVADMGWHCSETSGPCRYG